MSDIRMPKFKPSQLVSLVNGLGEVIHPCAITDFEFSTRLTSNTGEIAEGWFYQVSPSLTKEDNEWIYEFSIRIRPKKSTQTFRQMLSSLKQVPNA